MLTADYTNRRRDRTVLFRLLVMVVIGWLLLFFFTVLRWYPGEFGYETPANLGGTVFMTVLIWLEILLWTLVLVASFLSEFAVFYLGMMMGIGGLLVIPIYVAASSLADASHDFGRYIYAEPDLFIRIANTFPVWMVTLPKALLLWRLTTVSRQIYYAPPAPVVTAAAPAAAPQQGEPI